MHSIAFGIIAGSLSFTEDEEQLRNEKIERRLLRDASNPLELPQSL